MGQRHPRYVRSVGHALHVLRLFSPERPHVSVTEAAKALDLGKSTISRLLSTMAAEGFVTKSPETGRYGLGLRAYEVGLAYLSDLSLRRAAMPLLEEIAFTAHETVYLGVLGDRAAIYIDKILSPLSLRVDSHIGFAIPLHATALGKLLLAAQPAEYVDAVIASGLRAHTRRTIRVSCGLNCGASAPQGSRWTSRSSRRTCTASPSRSATTEGRWSPRSRSPDPRCGSRAR